MGSGFEMDAEKLKLLNLRRGQTIEIRGEEMFYPVYYFSLVEDSRRELDMKILYSFNYDESKRRAVEVAPVSLLNLIIPQVSFSRASGLERLRRLSIKQGQIIEVKRADGTRFNCYFMEAEWKHGGYDFTYSVKRSSKKAFRVHDEIIPETLENIEWIALKGRDTSHPH